MPFASCEACPLTWGADRPMVDPVPRIAEWSVEQFQVHENKTENTVMNRYETPSALSHDAETVADEARALLAATSEIADEKVTEARHRLEAALESVRETYGELKDRAMATARKTDVVIRRHPYESLAIAAGLGAVIGLLIGRRN